MREKEPPQDCFGCIFALTLTVGAAVAIGAYISAERFNARLQQEHLASLALRSELTLEPLYPTLQVNE